MACCHCRAENLYSQLAATSRQISTHAGIAYCRARITPRQLRKCPFWNVSYGTVPPYCKARVIAPPEIDVLLFFFVLYLEKEVSVGWFRLWVGCGATLTDMVPEGCQYFRLWFQAFFFCVPPVRNPKKVVSPI